MFLEARRHIKLTLLLAKRWLEIMDTLVTGKTYIFITGAAKSLITVLHKNENSIHVFDHKKQADRDIQMSVLNTGFCFEMVYAPSKVEIDVDSILDGPIQKSCCVFKLSFKRLTALFYVERELLLKSIISLDMLFVSRRETSL